MYRVLFSEAAKKQIKKLDKNTAKLLLAWIRKNLEGCTNPRIHGKGLTPKISEQWRYRIGVYRLIAEIKDEQIIILNLNIGQRKDIYK